MAKTSKPKLLSDADIFFKAIQKYQRNKKVRAALRSLLIVMAALSVLYLTTIYTPLKTVADLVRITVGQKYLVILANDAELRPSGGFIGSFAIIDARKLIPKIGHIETNIYTQDNLFEKQNFVSLPAPLQDNLGKNKSWSLHDSNWDPDFSVAAQYINWFYAQEYNDSVDGVILINTSAIKRLLNYTGPIKIGHGRQQLTADNIYEFLGNSVENDYWADPRNEEINQPKSVIADFEPALLKKTYTLPLGQILKFIRTTLCDKEVVFWNKNSKTQSLIERDNWSGATIGDGIFAATINATVGNKTNQNIKDQIKITYQTKDSTIDINETRYQNAPKGSFGSGENVSFAQILLPPTSTYQSFIINDVDSLNKAYRDDNERFASIGQWVKIDSDNPLRIAVKATLPENDAHKFCLFKQVGSQSAAVEIIIDGATVYNGKADGDVCLQVKSEKWSPTTKVVAPMLTATPAEAFIPLR